MDWNDIDLKLLAGMPIEINGIGCIHSPTMKEKISIGETRYSQILSVLLFEKDNLEGEINEKISDFEYLCLIAYHNESYKLLLLEGLKLYLKQDAHLIINDEDVFFIVGENRIDKGNFETFQDIIRRINWIKAPNDEMAEYNPADETTAQFIKEMLLRRKKKQKPKQEQTMNTHSIISGMAWLSNSVSILNIFDLTVYQFYDGFNRLQDINSSHYTLIGVYTGNVDSKKIKIQDLNFAKILKTT